MNESVVKTLASCSHVCGLLTTKIWHSYWERACLPGALYLNIYILQILFIYSDRERAHREGQSGGERERESQADSKLSAEPNVGLNLMTLKS